MSSSDTSEKPPENFNLADLSLEELLRIRQKYEQEVQSIQELLKTHYNCKAKYAASMKALDSFQPNWQNREILVPITSSMYVPGKIRNLDNFVIDMGTGNYVEKNLDDSKAYFNDRVLYAREQIEKIEKIHLQKSKFLHTIISISELKQIAAAAKQI